MQNINDMSYRQWHDLNKPDDALPITHKQR